MTNPLQANTSVQTQAATEALPRAILLKTGHDTLRIGVERFHGLQVPASNIERLIDDCMCGYEDDDDFQYISCHAHGPDVPNPDYRRQTFHLMIETRVWMRIPGTEIWAYHSETQFPVRVRSLWSAELDDAFERALGECDTYLAARGIRVVDGMPTDARDALPVDRLRSLGRMGPRCNFPTRRRASPEYSYIEGDYRFPYKRWTMFSPVPYEGPGMAGDGIELIASHS